MDDNKKDILYITPTLNAHYEVQLLCRLILRLKPRVKAELTFNYNVLRRIVRCLFPLWLQICPMRTFAPQRHGLYIRS